MRIFAIGDVHGHVDRLQALLDRAGIGVEHPDVEIVQLGDLGHWGAGTRNGDEECCLLAQKYKMVVLWGNHDRAIVDPDNHTFRGFVHPGPTAQDFIEEELRPRIAYTDGHYLLTHAGLHPNYMPKRGMNTQEEMVLLLNQKPFDANVITQIGPRRGGIARQGGVLWRDATEALADIPQVFGHTRGFIRSYNEGDSFCIDTGDISNGSLAGMWLDTGQIVAVGPDAEQFEKYPPVEC